MLPIEDAAPLPQDAPPPWRIEQFLGRRRAVPALSRGRAAQAIMTCHTHTASPLAETDASRADPAAGR